MNIFGFWTKKTFKDIVMGFEKHLSTKQLIDKLRKEQTDDSTAKTLSLLQHYNASLS